MAMSAWLSKAPALTPPPSDKSHSQREWDVPLVATLQSQLLNSAPDTLSLARLHAVFSPHSGAWLHALPFSSLGLRLEDSAIRISTALRLGLPICSPYHCRHYMLTPLASMAWAVRWVIWSFTDILPSIALFKDPLLQQIFPQHWNLQDCPDLIVNVPMVSHSYHGTIRAMGCYGPRHNGSVILLHCCNRGWWCCQTSWV